MQRTLCCSVAKRFLQRGGTPPHYDDGDDGDVGDADSVGAMRQRYIAFYTRVRAISRVCLCTYSHTHALSSLGGGEVKICAHTLIIMSIAVMRLKILINLFARNGRSAVRAQTRTHTHASADTFASAVAAASAAAVVGW